MEKAGLYIKKIVFNNDEEIDIQKDDIVIFVGPNNAGKSQCLKDIHNRLKSDIPTIVIKDIDIEKYPGSLRDTFKKLGKDTVHDKNIYQYFVRNIKIFLDCHSEHKWRTKRFIGDYRDVFIAKLDTENRLTQCKPSESINRNEAVRTPIQRAAFDVELGERISENFKKAFGKELVFNKLFGKSIPICVGDRIKEVPGFFKNIEEQNDVYAKILDAYPQLQDQGDGMKSFCAIALNLTDKDYCTFMIDEPESFLHPPQAYIMGQVIGESLDDTQQAFISTHSEELLKGILDTAEKRVKVIRIMHEDGEATNNISILQNEDIEKVWNDSLLKYSNILSGLFHKSVVICESDSDCKLYKIIDEHLKKGKGIYSEALFIHCGGKQRLPVVIRALKALDVNVRVITDFDVLNDENTIKNITTAIGINWDEVKPHYNNVDNGVRGDGKEKINRNMLKAAFNEVLGRKADELLSPKEIKELSNLLKTESKWKSVKNSGKSALPAGQASSSFDTLDTIFQNNGLFIVPVGELEGFVKSVGDHGPKWINEVLEKYPNFDDAVYEDVKKFVGALGI